MILYCLALNIMTLFGLIVILEWEMGRAESIGVVVMIGLSVDHVLNLAMAYQRTEIEQHISLRMKQAYSEAGVSILSGSFATLCSSLALFGGQIITFRKFAVILTTTVITSFLSSMLVFGSLVHYYGPEKGWLDFSCHE